MKVGVDAVILGAWVNVTGKHKVMDVGCGCGVISLMVAQRNPQAVIHAIDIDEESVAEAMENFTNSPWSSNLTAVCANFMDLERTGGISGGIGQNKGDVTSIYTDRKYDLIVSNPPYFDSGVSEIETRRERARHQGELSPYTILTIGKSVLQPDGVVAMVIPFEQKEDLIAFATSNGYFLQRELVVRGREGKQPKRSFMEFKWGIDKTDTVCEEMSIETSEGEYTIAYHDLCRDFYLKF